MYNEEKRGIPSQFYKQDAYTGNELGQHASDFCESGTVAHFTKIVHKTQFTGKHNVLYQLSTASDRPHCTSIRKRTNTIN